MKIMVTSSSSSSSPTFSALQSPFLNSSCVLSAFNSSSSSCLPLKSPKNQRPPISYPCIRAVDLDRNTIVAISVGFVSVAIGIGIPVFYETQIENAAKRENTQPCFPCSGSGAQKCRFCMGMGNVTVELGGDEKEVSKCINCDGLGSLTCTTCQGSGIQPRYLDRSKSSQWGIISLLVPSVAHVEAPHHCEGVTRTVRQLAVRSRSSAHVPAYSPHLAICPAKSVNCY